MCVLECLIGNVVVRMCLGMCVCESVLWECGCDSVFVKLCVRVCVCEDMWV